MLLMVRFFLQCIMEQRYEAVETINRSTIKYMEELEAELSSMTGYKKPEEAVAEKKSLKSRTDPECGYIHQARKKGLGYLTEMTVDTGHGIITGVDCYPANQRESDIILEHLKGQPCKYQEIGLDDGYDIGAVHRGLELLGLNGYTAIREYQNNAMKKDFVMRKKQIASYVDRGIFRVPEINL